ncbi:transposase [Sedimentitalea todarodis]|uniref:Transposase n=1 Tax=Sedimentitalea todarodis TaxID=1631240 RepID=A0ABU3VGM8_9RHOB|nr:transposase [Sedimentitalea todarodis]MDU9005334.1 transposase [Sedimentitalea todarodis]
MGSEFLAFALGGVAKFRISVASLGASSQTAHFPETIRQEIERLVDMGQALRESPDSQISLTDPDACSMATSAKGSGFVGYNAQSAVDTETHLIVTHDVINAGHEREQLSPMAKAAKAALGRDEMCAVADKGYFSGREIPARHEDGITTILPGPRHSETARKAGPQKPTLPMTQMRMFTDVRQARR